jgi:nicotinate dehydrogenase subunit A
MVTLRHKNKVVSVDAPAHAQLYHFIRNSSDDLSVRYGCGTGHCGACTVLVNDQAQNSCSTPLWSIDSAEIKTPQDLIDDPVGQVILNAFLSEQAAQCGFCINGILMRLTGLLKANAHATDEHITEVLMRHLCRCGAHTRIIRAAKLARDQLSQTH